MGLLCYDYSDGLVQDCSISIANALEILQSCTKPSILRVEVINVIIGAYSSGSHGWPCGPRAMEMILKDLDKTLAAGPNEAQ